MSSVNMGRDGLLLSAALNLLFCRDVLFCAHTVWINRPVMMWVFSVCILSVRNLITGWSAVVSPFKHLPNTKAESEFGITCCFGLFLSIWQSQGGEGSQTKPRDLDLTLRSNVSTWSHGMVYEMDAIFKTMLPVISRIFKPYYDSYTCRKCWHQLTFIHHMTHSRGLGRFGEKKRLGEIRKKKKSGFGWN